ncbi:peptidase M16 inactive domain protein [Ancylostoma caninum]|uniref:Peptidase M16 inactive domain protein n=2 Tax=Ancylostoma TaxID=29169 RepID=A0A368H7J0_ANCCA|nr:peptidase M16 inactive domain protein [Ancylostoma caninum]
MSFQLWTKSEVLMNGTIPITMYRSTRSRLLVAVGDVPGPMVKGCISFATEANCDDGLPHTLEHLVFMGSEKYPFKGILSTIANRCMASGENGWTCQDLTAYTLNTVGSEGFFKVLPVYLDHVLSPMLTCVRCLRYLENSQFATEVHHINGEGEDAGAIYNEMQGLELKMSNLIRRKRLEVLYPPNNPYRADVAGRLKNLRETCNLEKVRSFHRKFYHLSNMAITICGRLSHERLLRILEATEERPFSSVHLIPPSESTIHHVICPSDDESTGVVEISWFGCAATDFKQKAALRVLFDYLSSTSVSPLQQKFVLIDNPLSSQAVFSVNQQTTCILNLTFNGVPTSRLDEVEPRFMDEIVTKHLDDQAWDMERMSFVIRQAAVSGMREMEKRPDMSLFFHMFGHQLYDDSVEHFATRVNENELIVGLKSQPASFWSHLVERYFTRPHVTVVGVPSTKMVAEIAQEEAARLERQRQKLGSEGLKERAEKIRRAIEENSRKPDEELLKDLSVNELEEFNRFPVDVGSNIDGSPTSQGTTKFLEQFPFPTTVHSCPTTKFVELFFLFDSSGLTAEHRAWLLLYNELLFESPALIDGELKSAEEVGKLYTKELIHHSMQIGVSDFFDEFVVLRIVVDAETGFPNLAKWAEIFTSGVVFEAQRVKQCAKKLASHAQEKKRDGLSVANAALASIVNRSNSNAHMCNELVLEEFHSKVAEWCDTRPQDVVDKLEEVEFHSSEHNSSEATIEDQTGIEPRLTGVDVVGAAVDAGKEWVNAHFVCNVDLIDSELFNAKQWSFVEKRLGKAEKFLAIPGRSLKSPFACKRILVGVGGSESSFIYQTCMMDCDWMSGELVPTMLLAQYLGQTEGPLWRTIRGAGLAYSVRLHVRAEQRTISLSLGRCAQPVLAYERIKKCVEEALRTVVESEFEAAKRSLIAGLVKREETVSDAGELSIIGQLAGLPQDFRKDLCEQVWNASSEEMIRLGGPQVANLFKNNALVIVTPPSKLHEIISSFAGIQEATISSLSFIPELFT